MVGNESNCSTCCNDLLPPCFTAGGNPILPWELPLGKISYFLPLHCPVTFLFNGAALTEYLLALGRENHACEVKLCQRVSQGRCLDYFHP